MTEKQFKIDQLRKDKIIYATESVAISVFCILTYNSANYIESSLFPLLKNLVKPGSVLIALGYLIYMGLGNYRRLNKIQKLESK